MTTDLEMKSYVRIMDEQAALYENYARKHGMQSKSLQLLLWVTNYPLATGNYVTQKLLAEKTYSTKQVVNATVKSWQKQGYVELRENASDKRHKLVVLTEKGREFASSVVEKLNRIEHDVVQVLTEEEQQTLTALTAKYNAALKLEMEKAYDKI